MPQGLTYATAVRLLGGPSPLVAAADNLLGGALSLATAGGSELALGLFDAKAEAIRLGHLVAGRLTETVRGLGRYDRSRRLQAAHGVLVVAAFFESLDEGLATAGLGSPGFTRDDQLLLAAGPAAADSTAGSATPGSAAGGWPEQLLNGAIPVPSPERAYDQLLADLRQWFAALAARILDHLTGLAVWDRADARTRRLVEELLPDALPDRAGARYEEIVRRLSGEVPEFAIWMHRLESRAATRGLAALESALLRATSGRNPARHRAALAAVYRAELDRPILGGDAGDVVVPTLAAAYVDPRFRVQAAGAGSRPAEQEWWEAEPRGDLAGFLATYLTTPQAADVPMLLLGQPGAGKSSLTRILAARLPAADFLVVRVALRDVSAEAPIQDQVEQALRDTVGETVTWADLARDAGAAMPVILLDGFDELLQATGVHQSDYLQRVAAFQQREAVLGRPVAVLVTTREAVADRARLPAGGLAVRLEPFEEPQVARWLETWNGTNAARFAATGRRALPLAVLRGFPELAAQPLLLLMLALYDAAGNELRGDGETFDTGQLYERLLSEFAGREVRRVHAGQPEPALPGLVEAELLRLSVVAFAMFHRLRLWATTPELDADLAGLGLRASRQAGTEGFRTPVTAGQEMVGRFFFIQRAQAHQDDRTLQTYEFLHATFGEYLVARLVVQAVRDAAARGRARTLLLGPADDDGLLRSLLGFTPLTARTTVLPFAAALLHHTEIAEVRAWLVDRLRTAVTRPRYVPGEYQPVDKRADHWMATYSFNLMLLVLACGGQLRASQLFAHAKNPASWLGGMALQWRSAVPEEMWLAAMDSLLVTRAWVEDGRRDLILETTDRNQVDDVDPFWSHSLGPDWAFRQEHPGSGFSNYFPLGAALKSMHLSNSLGEDAVRHAVEPLVDRLPETTVSFVLHGPEDTESIAHSLTQLWLVSALEEDPERLLSAYHRAVKAVAYGAWGRAGSPNTSAGPAISLVLRSLTADANRLPAVDLHRLVDTIRSSDRFDASMHLLPTLECVLTDRSPTDPGRELLISELLADAEELIGELSPEHCLSLLIALSHSPATAGILERIDARLAAPDVRRRMAGDPDLAARLTRSRDLLRDTHP